ncbi:MAG: hypothetical protein FJ161_02435 [Gammaproteobacteria bacterium]|nr:hypothetical protein [Gammaproteobacteria bacterium]
MKFFPDVVQDQGNIDRAFQRYFLGAIKFFMGKNLELRSEKNILQNIVIFLFDVIDHQSEWLSNHQKQRKSVDKYLSKTTYFSDLKEEISAAPKQSHLELYAHFFEEFNNIIKVLKGEVSNQSARYNIIKTVLLDISHDPAISYYRKYCILRAYYYTLQHLAEIELVIPEDFNVFDINQDFYSIDDLISWGASQLEISKGMIWCVFTSIPLKWGHSLNSIQLLCYLTRFRLILEKGNITESFEQALLSRIMVNQIQALLIKSEKYCNPEYHLAIHQIWNYVLSLTEIDRHLPNVDNKILLIISEEQRVIYSFAYLLKMYHNPPQAIERSKVRLAVISRSEYIDYYIRELFETDELVPLRKRYQVYPANILLFNLKDHEECVIAHLLRSKTLLYANHELYNSEIHSDLESYIQKSQEFFVTLSNFSEKIPPLKKPPIVFSDYKRNHIDSKSSQSEECVDIKKCILL